MMLKYRLYPLGRESEEYEEDLGGYSPDSIYDGIQGEVYSFGDEKIMTFNEGGEDNLFTPSEQTFDPRERTFEAQPVGQAPKKLYDSTVETIEVVDAEIVYEPPRKRISRAKDQVQDSFSYSDGTTITIKRDKKKEEDEDSIFEF